jgi:hypothetical protein
LVLETQTEGLCACPHRLLTASVNSILEGLRACP